VSDPHHMISAYREPVLIYLKEKNRCNITRLLGYLFVCFLYYDKCMNSRREKVAEAKSGDESHI